MSDLPLSLSRPAAGDIVYVAEGSAGVEVADFRDPAHPARLASFDTPGDAHGVWAEGGYLYVADGGAGLTILDVHDPAAPDLAGHYDTTGSSRAVAVSQPAWLLRMRWLIHHRWPSGSMQP